MTRARNSANLASQGNLFVDIANDRTGIGSVVPAQNLHVAGTAGFHADTTFVGDLYNTTWDRSDNSLKFVDNAKAKFGTGEDLQIYHDSNNSYIENSTNGLFIRSDSLQLYKKSSSERYIVCAADAAVKLFHNDSLKIETTAYGTNTTGTAVNDGLVVAGVATVTTMNVTGVLTYDDVTSVDSVGIVTARQGVRVNVDSGAAAAASATNYISVGASQDLKIYHDGSHSRITNNTGFLALQSDQFTVNDLANSEGMIRAYANGAVELYHNGTKRLETTHNSVSITGNLQVSQSLSYGAILNCNGDVNFNGDNSKTILFDKSDGALEFSDDARLRIGDGNHFQIFHDGTDTRFANNQDHNIIKITSNEDIEIYKDQVKRVGITTRTAISSHTGTANAFGQLSVNTSGTGDGIALFIGAHAAIPSTHASGNATTGVTTAIYVNSSYAKRPEIRFHTSHNGNWHDSPGNTSHLRMVWTTPESSTTPEVVDIHPRVVGSAGGAFDGLRIRVTDNSNGLRDCLLLRHDNQYFYVNNSTMVQISSDGLGIEHNLYHRGDTDTKLSFPAANTITAITGGTERLRIHSTGQISANVNNNSYELTISGLSGGPTLWLRDSGTTGSPRILFGDTSAALIGGITYNNSSDHMEFATNGTERLRIASDGVATFSTTNINVNRNAGDAFIALQTSGTSNVSLYGGASSGFRVFTKPSGGSLTERLRIASTGQVLIGTTTPSGYSNRLLTVAAADGDSSIELRTATDHAGQISFSDGSAGDATNYRGYIQYNHDGDYMRFGTSSTERIRIDSIGRLLVNRTSTYASSSERLSVNGMTSIQGSSTSTAPLYVFNTESTADGTVQPFFFLHDGSGIRGGLGLQRSTSNFVINGQNAIQFRTGSSGVGGTERLRIDSAGRLTVGATSHTSNGIAEFHRDIGGGAEGCHILVKNTSTNSVNNTARLKLETSGGTAQFYAFATNVTELRSRVGGTADWKIRADGASNMRFFTNDIERLRIDSSGRLLLRSGTTSSSTRVGGFNPTLQVEGSSAESASIAITRNSAAENPPYLLFGKSRGTSLGSNTGVAIEDKLGIISFNGSDGSGSFGSYASIYGVVDKTPGNADHPGRLAFFTTQDGGVSPQERLRIDSNGDAFFAEGIYFSGANTGISNDQGRLNCLGGGVYGVSIQHGTSVVLTNEQGSTTQAMVLGDTSGGTNGSALWGVSINNSTTDPTTGSESGWSEKARVEGNGDFVISGSYTPSGSDDRLKKNKVGITSALTKVCAMEGFTFEWNDVADKIGMSDGDRHFGLSAQTVEPLAPEVVVINDMLVNPDDGTNDYKTIRYDRLVPMLVEAIKDLKSENDSLKTRISALESS